MKISYYIPLFCMFSYLPIHAQEESSSSPTTQTTPTSSVSLSTLINEIQNAPDDQKRILMNNLKIQLRAMSQENRQKTIQTLQQSFNSHQKEAQKKQTDQKENTTSIHQELHHQPTFRQLQRGGIRTGGNHQGGGNR